ncbi:thiamine pyrophosphate-binding protein [Xanthobacter tagetidis]|uniref:Thiamine pyrophosphate-binding protein n=1 Tax=Xanthobacter tagetidis TaxID=60216 RepID=A0A3L7AKG3_9HYPH|nr:thiamine pyrophosphate-binding protein [Xanthobacter tagetidis]MBB6307453.1 acetolactate synthase-1/2/3 large subunit [Xanthobacter tagetidis]RLP81036.1 thiamine pyrophosphate-binding protein [Xanthobacter tagetidis]
MTPKPNSRTGGRILVDQLLIHGADTAFCVPGESYLEVLDALFDARDRFSLVNARHEAGAANMAEAYGKLTGRPGIAMVTRGPGACHAAVGVHTAFQDSTPMILLIGQVGRDMMDREAFQEIDYRQMFGPVAKWAAQIDVTARIPEYMARAFRVATSGRPGPVVLALPEDMLTETADTPDAAPWRPVEPTPPPEAALETLRALLDKSERPLVLIGGPGWTDAAAAAIRVFAEANGLPVATSFRRQDAFDHRSESFAGDLGTSGPPSLVRDVKEADLLLVVGARLGEMTTQGYTVLDSPQPRQVLVHVHPDPDELGRVYAPDLAVSATAGAMAAALGERRWFSPARWAAWRERLRTGYLDALRPSHPPGELDLPACMAALAGRLGADGIVTVDAGNHTGWPQRFLPFGRPGRLLGPTSGAMGYSVPAGVAAALVHPDRVVVSCVGDGGFMMSGQEIATAVQHGGKPIVLLFNNSTYGTIRMHQEREHPGRVVGTDLVNPDFVAMAAAMGAHAERVTRTEEFAPALDRALAAGRAALIELAVDPEIVSTRTTISALRAKARG